MCQDEKTFDAEQVEYLEFVPFLPPYEASPWSARERRQTRTQRSREEERSDVFLKRSRKDACRNHEGEKTGRKVKGEAVGCSEPDQKLKKTISQKQNMERTGTLLFWKSVYKKKKKTKMQRVLQYNTAKN